MIEAFIARNVVIYICSTKGQLTLVSTADPALEQIKFLGLPLLQYVQYFIFMFHIDIFEVPILF